MHPRDGNRFGADDALEDIEPRNLGWPIGVGVARPRGVVGPLEVRWLRWGPVADSAIRECYAGSLTDVPHVVKPGIYNPAFLARFERIGCPLGEPPATSAVEMAATHLNDLSNHLNDLRLTADSGEANKVVVEVADRLEANEELDRPDLAPHCAGPRDPVRSNRRGHLTVGLEDRVNPWRIGSARDTQNGSRDARVRPAPAPSAIN
jgi:hypothetical protein